MNTHQVVAIAVFALMLFCLFLSVVGPCDANPPETVKERAEILIMDSDRTEYRVVTIGGQTFIKQDVLTHCGRSYLLTPISLDLEAGKSPQTP